MHFNGEYEKVVELGCESLGVSPKQRRHLWSSSIWLSHLGSGGLSHPSDSLYYSPIQAPSLCKSPH